MNDLFKDKLQQIVNDDLFIKALKAVFDERIEKEKPQTNDTDDNFLLGEKYRAYEQGKRFIEKSFVDLLLYKANKAPVKTFRKER